MELLFLTNFCCCSAAAAAVAALLVQAAAASGLSVAPAAGGVANITIDYAPHFHSTPSSTTRRPLFGWVVPPQAGSSRGLNGVTQSSYRVRAARVPSSGEAQPVWDSGAVASNASTAAFPAGAVPLLPDSTYSLTIQLGALRWLEADGRCRLQHGADESLHRGVGQRGMARRHGGPGASQQAAKQPARSLAPGRRLILRNRICGGDRVPRALLQRGAAGKSQGPSSSRATRTSRSEATTSTSGTTSHAA